MQNFTKIINFITISSIIYQTNSIEINQIYHKNKEVVLKFENLEIRKYHVHKNHGKTHNNDRNYFI